MMYVKWLIKTKKMKSLTRQDNNKYSGSRDDDSSFKNLCVIMIVKIWSVSHVYFKF